MTGMHAEMLVVQGMMDNNIMRALLCDEAIVVANARPCLFCENVLEGLGVKSGGLTDLGLVKFDDPNRSAPSRPLTAWWNPFTDKVYGPHNHTEWSDNVPGGMDV